MKSGNLNFLEPSGPLQACNGTAALHINIRKLLYALRTVRAFLRKPIERNENAKVLKRSGSGVLHSG